jgi:dihydroxyacid dehydratase/phosphogluconate dehydratase
MNSAPLRSREWFDSPELYSWTRRAALQGMGYDRSAFEGRPVIGICNTASHVQQAHQGCDFDFLVG